MKSVLTKITAVLMTFVVLFSTMSITVNSHYCGDYLVGVSYFGKAKSCGMEMASNTKLEECSITKKNCCNDTVHVIKGQDDLKNSLFDSLSFQQQLFIVSFFTSYHNLFSQTSNTKLSIGEYVSPILVKNIRLLIEVYLI